VWLVRIVTMASRRMEADERRPLLSTCPDSSEQGAATARLYSGELGKEEHQNLSNQLQEEAQYFGEDYDDDGYGGDEEAVLLPGSPRNPPSVWERHKNTWWVLVSLVVILGLNALVIYFVYFHNCVRLKVLAYNVWGMPGGIGGCKDKEDRIQALSWAVGNQSLGANQEDFDLILFEELWMQADHNTIQSNIPEGFHMTEFRGLASAACDGRVLISKCSGLAVVSRYPFTQIEFNEYTWKGSIWDGEAFAGKGIGRVRIEPKPGLKIDVFVTHTIADSGTTMYNNTWARIKQVEELMDSYILKSDADAVILGGDFNTGPEKTEGSPFQILTSRGLTNSVQEIFYKLDAWLHTEFSTYGNPRNTFSYTYSPIIYDYIFHRTVTPRTVCWTNWFELPLFTTKLLGGALESLRSPLNTSSAATLEAGQSLTISLSDHEPVISTLYVRKWSSTFPYL